MKKSPDNMSRIICIMTIIAALLFGAINAKVYAREPGKDQKKIYVSTVGMPFFVKNDVQYSNNDFISLSCNSEGFLLLFTFDNKQISSE